eukprot:TRINITY_DN10275_c0_g3_i1.p1 TRINITY_DN10275_c0_g3~~TRINITY_DN10275_c0_g3_i1.p1  ORF type:complete len:110 (-),score=13.99 TRINITY_DN10275_c0_g3_i1:1693-2022(-)
MVFPLPKSVTNDMERLMRNFLWSLEETQSRKNQIRWDVVCLPTKGGLGIRQVHEKNEASFLKLGWATASSSSLWANWIRCTFFKNKTIQCSSTQKTASYIWGKPKKFPI